MGPWNIQNESWAVKGVGLLCKLIGIGQPSILSSPEQVNALDAGVLASSYGSAFLEAGPF